MTELATPVGYAFMAITLVYGVLRLTAYAINKQAGIED